MSLIHPALLYACGLAVIPVILHFLLRAKPKKLVFPALRLIQLRRRQNVRRMKLRHVWLMLLRILVILGIVLAVTRPSLPEASYELSTREQLTLFGIVAAAVGTYFGLMHVWRRKSLSVQTLAYRRSMLRGGLGAAVFALLVLFVVWPYVNRLRAEISAPAPAISSDLPVAAVFLFDTSLSMQYMQQGKTRLDEAKLIAANHMDALPPRSRIAVGETASTSPILFQADLVGAKSRIQNLSPQPVTQPLNERLRAALAIQQHDQGRTLDEQQSVPQDARRDRFIREVYLFTDLAATAWRTSDTDLLKEELERTPWVAVYVIDVGETAPQDVGVTDIRLSHQSVAEGGTLLIDATLSSIGNEESDKTIELSLRGRDDKLLKQAQQPVKVSGSTGATAQFTLSNLQGPIEHGELRLLSSDPLSMNDVRFFTVAVKPPPKVLLVSPNNAVGDVLQEILAPEGIVKAGKARYVVEHVRSSKLATAKLNEYSIVILNSVPKVSDAEWKLLQKFVSGGGGLAVFVGSNELQELGGIDSNTYRTDAAKTILPATLNASLTFHSGVALDPKNLNHPAFRKLEELNAAGDLAAIEVRKFWTIQELTDGANVLMSFTDPKSHAAIIERRVGAGRVVMLTTAADLRGWNDFLLGGNWPFVVLTDQLMQYLAGRNEANFNFLCGEDVILRPDSEPPLTKYLLRKPGQQQLPGTVPPGASSFAIRETDQVGHFDVLSADPLSKFVSGFSVNAAATESDFHRLTEDDLIQLFGEKRFSMARDIATLQRRVTTGRLGEEVYPLILLVALVVFVSEHLVANWFYSQEGDS